MDFNEITEKLFNNINIEEDVPLLLKTTYDILNDLSKSEVFIGFINSNEIRINEKYIPIILHLFKEMSIDYEKIYEFLILDLSAEEKEEYKKDLHILLHNLIDISKQLRTILELALPEDDLELFRTRLSKLISTQFDLRKEAQNMQNTQDTQEEQEELNLNNDNLNTGETIYVNNEISITKVGDKVYKITKSDGSVTIMI